MMTNYELAKHLIDVMRQHEQGRSQDGVALVYKFEAELAKWRFPDQADKGPSGSPHRCDAPAGQPHEGYGAAVEYCLEAEGDLWVGNGEYATRVNYCPFCGFKSRK